MGDKKGSLPCPDVFPCIDEDSVVVERKLRGCFPGVTAYRYNSASIRVAVVDEVFVGKSLEQRLRLVEAAMKGLLRRIQGDIIMILCLTPGETGPRGPRGSNRSSRFYRDGFLSDYELAKDPAAPAHCGECGQEVPRERRKAGKG
jgi:hypothetical protein